MNLSGIISISGMSGLYKVIAQSKSGLIIESIVDKKRTTTPSTQKVSSLEDISMYTTGEDVLLKVILGTMKETLKGGQALDHKSPDADLRKFFESVLPTYDKDRVYTSDIKKVIMWYNILQANDMLKDEPVADTEAAEKALKAIEKNKTQAAKHNDVKVKSKTAAGVKKTTGVRKTGVA